MPFKPNKIPFTAEELREILHYDKDTGKLTWRVKTAPNTIVGKEAGWLDSSHGYRRVKLNRNAYLAHRLIYFWCHGVEPEGFLDHINGIRNDNRIENLRPATPQQNNFNTGKRKDNTSSYKGVSWKTANKKFQAQCKVNGKNHHLGLYPTAEAAYAAYVAFVTEHHGEFARTA